MTRLRLAFGITLLLGELLSPVAAETQQTATSARIGYLGLDLANVPRLREAFLHGLRDLGYVEGHNVVIEYRDAEGKLERLPALAAELVAQRPSGRPTGSAAPEARDRPAQQTSPPASSQAP
jgi:hypothetical protein